MTGQPEPKSATPHRTRRIYSADDRRNAVEGIKTDGLAATHQATGIPRQTLSDWTRQARIDVAAKARARTATARTVSAARAAETKLTTIDRLKAILDDQLAVYANLSHLERTASELAVARAKNPHTVRVAAGTKTSDLILAATDPELGQALGLLSLLTAATPKRDVVGAVGQAIDKLTLLQGKPQEHGPLVVHFGIPRPSATESDAAAIPEAELHSLLSSPGSTS